MGEEAWCWAPEALGCCLAVRRRFTSTLQRLRFMLLYSNNFGVRSRARTDVNSACGTEERRAARCRAGWECDVGDGTPQGADGGVDGRCRARAHGAARGRATGIAGQRDRGVRRAETERGRLWRDGARGGDLAARARGRRAQAGDEGGQQQAEQGVGGEEGVQHEQQGGVGRRLGWQAASLAGVAPHPHESGQRVGYRRVRGGRTDVKRTLFMAALVASQGEGRLAEVYRSLIARRKKPIVAVTALMRKLIVIANAKLRDDAAHPAAQVS